MEYFFKENDFGYKIGPYELSIQKNQIKNIKTKPNYLLIHTLKGKLYFVSTHDQIEKVKHELLDSEYKNLIHI